MGVVEDRAQCGLRLLIKLFGRETWALGKNEQDLLEISKNRDENVMMDDGNK